MYMLVFSFLTLLKLTSSKCKNKNWFINKQIIGLLFQQAVTLLSHLQFNKLVETYMAYICIIKFIRNPYYYYFFGNPATTNI